jgi:hypothetical protein
MRRESLWSVSILYRKTLWWTLENDVELIFIPQCQKAYNLHNARIPRINYKRGNRGPQKRDRTAQNCTSYEALYTLLGLHLRHVNGAKSPEAYFTIPLRVLVLEVLLVYYKL